ncbi:MFS transporter [Streptomyces sp. SID13726]|uniref:MFS transporter n=1 Tax=Streptomyces sp. SID13726 TaxID=2706058 RepID=UPI0013B9A76A|nr:MFS transporter [Streptomyces sp. SID13726]NEB03356.1 MHS family MFS transporter [Streptomyces sp. SID13726]
MSGSQLPQTPPAELRRIITASSTGTLIEWYDFFVYGSLAVVFSGFFFPSGESSLGLLVSVAAFGTGFVVRPLGAVFFGRLGDRVGRKKTFLATLVVMGAATTLIGCLPRYDTIGTAAPVLLVLLRLVQGFAVGGEYGGAATYVAEHAPADRKGTYTSFLQTTATLGLLLSIGVVVACRLLLGEDAFTAWGWRLPFLLSAVLVLLSLRMRLKLHESPVFVRMQAQGTISRAPVREALGDPRSLRLVLLTVFGLTAGLGAVWYTSQFYALYFLQSVLKVDFLTTNVCMAVALVLGTPSYVVFGRLSDRYGRQRLLVTGLALSAVSFLPLYAWMREAVSTGSWAQVVIAVTLQIVFSAMVYAPTAAYLTELFPPRIRYTGLSVSYHLGAGVFGGFVPLIALSLTESTGNQLAGLAYPIAVAAVSTLISVTLLRGGAENRFVRAVWDRMGTTEPAGSREPAPTK